MPWRRVRPKGICSSLVRSIIAGDAAGSLETIKAYMRLDPFYPEFALYFSAQAQHSLGQFDAAVATLKRRLERNPRSETTYALLASCYGHLGQITESRLAWAEVMRIAPDFSVERRWRIIPFNKSRLFGAPYRRLAQGGPSRIAHHGVEGIALCRLLAHLCRPACPAACPLLEVFLPCRVISVAY